jgi:hypothetical protein
MKKYRIYGNYGYIGTGWEDFIEAESDEEAEEIALEKAMEMVSYGAEPIED